jgi:hypothetical protein
MVPRRAAIAVSAILSACLALALSSCSSDDDVTGPGGDVDIMSQLGVALTTRLGNYASGFRLPSGPPGCLTIAPSPFADADSDGVPDSVRFSFDETGCTFVFDGGSGTSMGTIEVTDPGAVFGFRAIHAMTYALTAGDPPSTETLGVTGTRIVSGASDGLTLTEDVQLAFSTTGNPPCAATERYTATFTPEPGSNVVFGVGVPLPSGHIELAGAFVWEQEGTTVTMVVSTAAPIEIDADCLSPFPVAGEVRFQVTSGADPGYVSVRFTGCGSDMEVDWVPAD